MPDRSSPIPESDFEIAFTSNRNGFWSIYTVDERGTQAKLIDIVSVEDGPQRFALDLLGQLDWTSDGERFLFTCTPQRSEICVATPGGDVEQVTADGGRTENYGEWMPDDDQIVFSSFRDGSFDIYVTSSSGNQERPLVAAPRDESSPTVSPDGRTLAYVEEAGGSFTLHLSELSDTGMAEPDESVRNATMPAWSPVADQLVVTRVRGDRFSDLYLIDRRGRVVERLTHSPGLDMWATWSPDGEMIAFSRDSEFDGERYRATDLYILEIATGEITKITNDDSSNMQPAWRP